MPSRRAHALGAAVLALAVGCSAGEPGLELTIAPQQAEVPAGGTLQFGATVVGPADEPIVWRVAEEGGGRIDETGRYTAPAAPGTFHVTAYVGSLATLRSVEVRVRGVAAPTPEDGSGDLLSAAEAPARRSARHATLRDLPRR